LDNAQEAEMATMAPAPFDELVKLSSDFVAQRKGVWDHSAWLDFISKVQKKGYDVSEEMQAYLGTELEAMKRFYDATTSTEGMEKALKRIAKDSVAFISKHKGVWGESEWQAFAEDIQKNTVELTEETTAYLGGILESSKVFYYLTPPKAASTKKAPKAPAKAEPQPTRPAPDERDDLTAIAGVGPALEKKLNAKGIHSYAQLAALSDEDIGRLEETVIRFPGRIKRDDWVGQAKKLAQETVTT
jgi:predicted flap endonuclease-1-like 5' DNA nuclease